MQIGLGLWLGTRQVGDGSSLNLNFLSGSLDSRITFTRTTTATVVGSNGLVQSAAINAPRFDYDPVTLAPRGILIEEQRTNLLVRSEEFGNATWILGTNTITANTMTSPDGTADADTYTATATGTGTFVRQTATVVAATTYTTSLFVKRGTADFAVLSPFDGTDGNRYWFNLNTGAVASTALIGAGLTNPSARIENFGNGWYRCSVTFTNKTLTTFNFFASFADADASLTLTSGRTGFLYGAQLEVGAFATSYIPTVASQVTRTADQASIVAPMFAPWYNQTEGTFVVVGDSLTAINTGVPAFVMASDGTNSEYLGIFADNSAGRPQATVFDGGVVQSDLANPLFTITPNAPYAAAFAYKLNDFAMSTNGSAVSTDNTGTLPTVNLLGIGNRHGNSRFLSGHIRRITYYPVRLLDTQLQALTA